MAGKTGRMRNAQRSTPDAEVKAGAHPLVLFTSKDGAISIPTAVERESVWLTQAQMAELFGKERSVITKHIRNAVNEGELDDKSNVHFLHISHSDKPVAFYNLDVTGPMTSTPYISVRNVESNLPNNVITEKERTWTLNSIITSPIW